MDNKKYQDAPLMYCSYFSNGKEGASERAKLLGLNITNDITQKLGDAEGKCITKSNLFIEILMCKLVMNS
jgi:hypothetical protein